MDSNVAACCWVVLQASSIYMYTACLRGWGFSLVYCLLGKTTTIRLNVYITMLTVHLIINVTNNVCL